MEDQTARIQTVGIFANLTSNRACCSRASIRRVHNGPQGRGYRTLTSNGAVAGRAPCSTRNALRAL